MSFAAPLFLIAVAAGILPVLLHMIHHQKARQTPFSTLRFLKLSVQRTRRRKIVEDLLLLIVRAGVVMLIAVALANPIVDSLPILRGSGPAKAVAIIFDNSGSMGTIDGGRPRLETARNAAEQVLDMLHDGDAVAFFPTGGPTTLDQGKLYHTHETVRRALEQCRVSHERADLAGKLQQAWAVLAQSEIPNRAIYVITDNQALSWEGLLKARMKDEGRRMNQAEAGSDSSFYLHPSSLPDMPIIVINVNKDPLPNVALLSVRLEAPAPAVGVPITARVELVNTSTLPLPRNVELHLDGRKQAVSPTLNLAPGSTIRHEFRFAIDHPGIHRGEIRLAEEDGNPLDNRLFFVVAAQEQISAAIVIPRRHDIAYADESYYLERVLSPTEKEGWSIRPQVVTADKLADEPLANHAVVFCVNLPALAPPLAEKLRDYVEAGGHLFWICGDNVQQDAYNRMNEQAGGNLLPASLGPLREATPTHPTLSPGGRGQGEGGSWKIAAMDKDHPALQGLTEPASLYQSVLVHKHFPLVVTRSPDVVVARSGDRATARGSGAVRVLAQLEGEQPLLVERTVGAGSVLMLGTSAHVEWTNLPLRPIFLPLISRLTFQLAGVEMARSQVAAGAALLVPLPGNVESPEFEVVNPAGDILRVTGKADSGRFFRYADTHQVGTYVLRLLNARDPRNAPKQFAFAVNCDPEECDVATVAPEELVKRFNRGNLVYCENPSDVAGSLRRLREGQSLGEHFLFAVLIGLMLEAYLANCRGRRYSVTSTLAFESFPRTKGIARTKGTTNF